jgi:hypothetical protein
MELDENDELFITNNSIIVKELKQDEGRDVR